jgi:hypothetical protein
LYTHARQHGKLDEPTGNHLITTKAGMTMYRFPCIFKTFVHDGFMFLWYFTLSKTHKEDEFMKYKALLFISLVISSSILHAELNPLSGAASDMAKDAAADAIKEKATDTAKEMAKEAIAPAATTPTPAPTSTETPKATTESAPTATAKPVKPTHSKKHRKHSKRRR